jgi:hypothetical protein
MTGDNFEGGGDDLDVRGYRLNELSVGEELRRLGGLNRDALRFRGEDLWVIQVGASKDPRKYA